MHGGSELLVCCFRFNIIDMGAVDAIKSFPVSGVGLDRIPIVTLH